jgi:hypothetical protein
LIVRLLKLLPLVGAIALIAPIALAQGGVPAGSFIERPVSSPEDLIEHMRSDETVMSRYTRHFAMTREEVIEFVGGLRFSRLEHEGNYTVYGVPRSGLLRSHQRYLRRGTPVFVDRGGNPVLLVVCGNPLMRGPKRPFAALEPANPIRTAVEPAPMKAEIPTVGQEATTQVFQPEILPMQPTLGATTPTVISEMRDIPIVDGILPALGVLPALFLIGNTGGNEPVPDPATIATLGIGLAYFAKRSIKRGSR